MRFSFIILSGIMVVNIGSIVHAQEPVEASSGLSQKVQHREVRVLNSNYPNEFLVIACQDEKCEQVGVQIYSDSSLREFKVLPGKARAAKALSTGNSRFVRSKFNCDDFAASSDHPIPTIGCFYTIRNLWKKSFSQLKREGRLAGAILRGLASPFVLAYDTVSPGALLGLLIMTSESFERVDQEIDPKNKRRAARFLRQYERAIAPVENAEDVGNTFEVEVSLNDRQYDRLISQLEKLSYYGR